MSVALCVCGYNNPDYLYITLDGLFRVRKIENYPVYVFIDNNIDWKTSLLYPRVFQKYPLQYAHIYPLHVGDLHNTFESMNYCFKQGHDEVIYLEHDQHFMPDLLEYSESLIDISDFSINLGRKLTISSHNWFDMMGWRVSKDNFYEIWEWIKGKHYIGQVDTRCGQVMNDKEAMDGKIFMFFQMNSKTMHYSTEKDRIGSFGVTGVHATRSSVSEQYDRMFLRGDPHQWIFNVAYILYKGDYPQELETHLFPRYSPLYMELPNTEHYFDDCIYGA